ncbi:MAG: hypothetical protein OEM77_03555 [Nitrosopumilus sp.]|nr:hypothetical protein [Nitrosopumilus sp.]MDH3833787.1 hypothetical protein [Nitrosopumilus sp.]
MTEIPFCHICLNKKDILEYDRLQVCTKCLSNIKRLEQEKPPSLSKEQTADGIKDEL